MNEDLKPEPELKPEEDQERVNAKSMDGQKDDSEDLKKDIDESHVLKWGIKDKDRRQNQNCILGS